MSQHQFFSYDITELNDSDVYNVICRHKTNGKYCYAFYNEDTKMLSTGYEFDKGDDLDIYLDKDHWSWMDKSLFKKVNTINVLVLKDHIPFEVFSFSTENVNDAEKTFISKIKEYVKQDFSEDELSNFIEDGSCSLSAFSFEVYLIHSS